MADAKDSYESLDKRLISLAPLLKILECPVCMCTVKVPFKQCKQGHLVCCVCMKTLPKCPTCSAEFSLENHVTVKNLIESLPRPCQYEVEGCKTIVEPNERDHEIYCGFRTVNCKFCGVEMPIPQMREHSKKLHPNNTQQSLKSKIGLLDYQAETGTYSFSFFAFDSVFWLRFKKNSSKELALVDFVGVFIGGKPTSDYFITLKFEKNFTGPSVTLKASENAIDGGDEGICSSSIVVSSIKNCINEKGTLWIEYELFSKEKPLK